MKIIIYIQAINNNISNEQNNDCKVCNCMRQSFNVRISVCNIIYRLWIILIMLNLHFFGH